MSKTAIKSNDQRKRPLVSDESWADLVSKIDEAKLTLVLARKKVRSENAMFNFNNFVRGFVCHVEALVDVDVLHDRPITDFGDFNTVKLMAQATMFTYGSVFPRTKEDGDWTSVSITPYWAVMSPGLTFEDRNRVRR